MAQGLGAKGLHSFQLYRPPAPRIKCVQYCPLSNSWIIYIMRLYIAFNRTPNIDCYWGEGGGAVPNKYVL